MNIAICLNSKYIMPSLTCALSVIKNNNEKIKFFFIYSSLSSREQNFIKKNIIKNSSECSINFIEVDQSLFKNFPTTGRSIEAYYRILLPYILPQNIERCLYLDSDTLILKNIEEFYNQDFDNTVMVTCFDIGETLFFHKEMHPILNIPKKCEYFNSGVILFNTPLFKSTFKMDVFLDYIKNNSHKIKFLDQDVLNALCYNRTKIIHDIRYNFMEILINPLITNNGIHNASIVHFTQKPWKYTYNGVNAGTWWFYSKNTYRIPYVKFVFLNFIYKRFLYLILFFFSIKILKNIKYKIKSWIKI